MRKQRPRGTVDFPKTDNQSGAAQDVKAGLHDHRLAPVITTLFFWVWVFLAVKSEPQVNNVLGQSVILTHRVWDQIAQYKGFPSASVVKNPPADAGDARDVCSIPGSGRPPGEGNGNPLQYSCLGNPLDRGAWLGPQKESETTQWLNSNSAFQCQLFCFRDLKQEDWLFWAPFSTAKWWLE